MVLHLDVVEPGVDAVVLLHEVVEGPDLGAERRQVALVPGQVRLGAGVLRVLGLRLEVVTAEICQYRVTALLPLKLVLVILQ